MASYGCDVFGQERDLVPGFCLVFEVFDAVGVCIGGACFVYGGFPALLLLFGDFLVCTAFTFGGFSAEGDFLHDLGELVFEGPGGGVGPFRGAVWAAAAEDEAQEIGGRVIEAGDTTPRVLLGVGDFLLAGGRSLRSCSWRTRKPTFSF
ncbi:hypothetical protein [Streptomyces alanosinicus]|uniref:Uncharacterized protein n=1 Tax=Streptomyces alanosinicus TaxID=68171 RepID=A0A918YTZ9_9ACTN|nr:hypothetical protein [Streptomyces alanosinicus]GHE15525.1 hypothetical protein GCM10010339_90460 [Streptomyces alanosinicus]